MRGRCVHSCDVFSMRVILPTTSCGNILPRNPQLRITYHTSINQSTSLTMPSIHPAIDNGITKGDPNFKGGKLYCKCASNKVEVTLAGNVAHNHACGCSKCWKPDGALFSVVGVIPIDQVSVTANAHKLHIIDPSAAIQRNACKDCGVHLFGRIVTDHPFKGLDFVHTELSDSKGWQEPQFAAFVSSVIEQGFRPNQMDDVRAKFQKEGLQTYDVLSPVLMDLIATYTGQKSGRLPSKL
jgi:S-(hydroxymethyl)glutathione synthase